MLVLSRREGERIVIGENITLVISKVSGNRVAIGIEAPRDVKVVRGELKDEEEITIPVSNSRKSEGQALTLRDFAASVLPLQRQVG